MNRIAGFLLLGVVFATPLTASAANLPLFNPQFSIVPEACRECPCGLAGALQLAQNLMNAGVSLAVLIMILVIAYAGALFLFGASNPEMRSQGKKMLSNAVIGLVIVLAAWLIIDFVMKALYNGESTGWGPWNEILSYDVGEMCIQGMVVGQLYDAPEPGVVTTTPSDCKNCSSIAERGIACKSSNSCTAQPTVVNRLATLDSNFSGSWRVTEAFPPTYKHSNPCHTDASCVDAAFVSPTSYTEANVKSFMQTASRSGFKPVFETTDCKLRDAMRKAGYSAYCKSDTHYTHITGTHFSLYSI